MAISPKRNAERKAFNTILQQFRQQNKTYEGVLNEAVGQQMNDSTFNTYPTVPELFYLSYENKSKAGGELRHYMKEVTEEFNQIIGKVFNEYAIVSDWNAQAGNPDIKVRKGTSLIFPIEGLSLGEQEVMSLILNIYMSVDKTDVYLIDEPEVHLNWHLEERLFEFLKVFAEDKNRQFIISTHSRVIFKKRFEDHVQSLSWENESLFIRHQLSPEFKQKIAGEAIEIIKMGEFKNLTIFCEDTAHEEFYAAIAENLSLRITANSSGTSANVKSLFKLSQKEGNWSNCYFMIDGDNQGNPFPNQKYFVQLEKYCLENYYFNLPILSKMQQKTEAEIQCVILECLLENRHEIFKSNKYLAFLLDKLVSTDLTAEALDKLDLSALFDSFIKKLGFHSRHHFMKKYISEVFATSAEHAVFGALLYPLTQENMLQSHGGQQNLPAALAAVP